MIVGVLFGYIMKNINGILQFYRGSSILLRKYGEYILSKITLNELKDVITEDNIVDVISNIEFDERFNFSAIEFLLMLYEQKNNFKHLPINTIIFFIKYSNDKNNLKNKLNEYYKNIIHDIKTDFEIGVKEYNRKYQGNINIIKFIGNYEFIHYAEKILINEYQNENKILELPTRIVWNEIYSIPAYLTDKNFLLCRGIESIKHFIEKNKNEITVFNLITDRFIYTKEDEKFLLENKAKFFILKINNPDSFELFEVSLRRYLELYIQNIPIGEICG